MSLKGNREGNHTPLIYEGCDCPSFQEWLKGGSSPPPDTNFNLYIMRLIECRRCDKEGHERHDWYGISTGYWCDECYESNRYPYKKSRYATEEYDGYGERLSND